MAFKHPHIAILGLGYKSTQFYIKQLNEAYLLQHGNYASFPFYMFQADFGTINPFLPDQFEHLKPTLETILQPIEKLPIKQLLVPNITLHETLDQLDINIKLIHPLEITANYLKSRNLKNVVLFGTHYSMNANYIQNYFKQNGINVSAISNENQNRVEQLRKSLYNHDLTEIELSEYIDLVHDYKTKTIVICCTELSIVNKALNAKNTIDMAVLQIEETLRLQDELV
jgi:aspartate racemase